MVFVVNIVCVGVYLVVFRNVLIYFWVFWRVLGKVVVKLIEMSRLGILFS